MTNAMFTSQGGTCFSCHYNDVETQTLGRWDDYKYNLYHGITDVAAEEVQVTTSYDQTTITPAENRFFKTVKDEPVRVARGRHAGGSVHLRELDRLHRRRLRQSG